MDSDIKRPKRDPLPSRSAELRGAREALVEGYLRRYFEAINFEMEMVFHGDQSPDELGHSLDVIQTIYAKKIIKSLYR